MWAKVAHLMEQTTWAGLRSPWLLEPVADSPLFICEKFLIDTAPFEIDMLAPFDIYSEDKMFICCQEKYQNLLDLHVFLHLFVIKYDLIFNYIEILSNIKLIRAARICLCESKSKLAFRRSQITNCWSTWSWKGNWIEIHQSTLRPKIYKCDTLGL